MRISLSGGGFQEYAGQIGGFSHESEHDLAVMVSDFMENGSGGSLSWCSSDSDSVVPDLQHLSEKILFLRHTVDQYECDLSSVVRSLVLSLSEADLHVDKDRPCNASCIRRSLVKLLRVCGYDAAICISKWQGSGKVPGGEHEYIDVVNCGATGSERMIIDIDFRSHFEIARAIDSYDAILKSLPVVYTGYWPKLKQLLQVMAEAAKSSLMQNSMPVPPWRSLGYLQAKWQSDSERIPSPNYASGRRITHCRNNQCFGHLRRLKSSLQSEIEKERLLKPIPNGPNRRMKGERRRHRSLLSINL
ncbi:unnamed protein product [Spirodela intermedia]|uniref:Uncharacterized protein n=2 Tax=Spirodela intermedia TaxID=51605 RepID=A0A7I8JIY7_SPIIN|nr:unnamed protein product [Spirodela intermedia]CAA6669382.1 unnamed protein product [Spirodela intermedia]CAA7406332.1 unnamed protein product [Spirodela intermedia]